MIKVLAFLLGLSVPVSLQSGLIAGISTPIVIVQGLILVYFIVNWNDLRDLISSFTIFSLLIFLLILFPLLFSQATSHIVPALRTFFLSFSCGSVLLHFTIRRKTRYHLYVGFITGCTICSIAALILSASGFERGIYTLENGGAINELSILIGLGIVLVLTSSRSLKNTLLTTILLLILLIGLFSYQSRSAIIALFITLIFLSFKGGRLEATMSKIFIVAIFFSVGVGFVLPDLNIADRLQDVSDPGRSMVWEASLQLPLSHYILGGGYGTSAYFTSLRLGFEMSPHSIWIQMLVELGTIGVVITILILIRSGRLICSVPNFKITYVAAMLFLSVSTLTLHFIQSPVFWFLILIACNRTLERFQSLNRS
jgi:O-antigen ligase